MQTYHHGNLRPALIEAAAELARTHGPDGVVLREVARRSGVSHNAAYRHFADREELLAEVAVLGMDRLEQAMMARVGRVRTTHPQQRARRRLREIGRAYVLFALAEPGLFQVAFAAKARGAPSPEALASSGPYAVLGRALDDLVDVGVLASRRRVGADVACWSAVHGFAMLHLHGPLQFSPEAQRDADLDALLDVVERGLSATSDDTCL